MKNIMDLIHSVNYKFLDVFGEVHTIDGKKINISIDGDTLDRLNTKLGVGLEGNHGFSGASTLYFVCQDDLDKIPRTGDVQIFDGRRCVIEDVRNDAGILRIVLSQPRG